jgi:hypothetical protein
MENITKIVDFIKGPFYGGDVIKAIDKRICVLCERKVNEFEYFLDSGICEKCLGTLFDKVLTYKKRPKLKRAENAKQAV